MSDQGRFKTQFDMLRRNLKHVFHGPSDSPFADLIEALNRPLDKATSPNGGA